ncbi:DNA repair protein RecO [[Clostridium] ultunense Esp]|uniref:DNA repair protein RecO n=1 Tax=Thermicanus aegyptius TaxID=94009 RepID=UPI0002B70D7D|nr:DNA repair protein RecO [Thermicanus aegyptius]CCQ96075.1 DNA repair protein RecO [[Clostridium] ultunense Esp]
MVYKVEGIVIHSLDYGEGSKILTIFTKELGKISVLAKGAKKTKSRFSAVSELFTYGAFVFYQSGKGLGNLNQGDVLYSFRHIREDIFRSAWASYLVEIVDKSVEEQVSFPELFTLLYQSLLALDTGKDMEIVARIFELQYLGFMGNDPELFSCSICRRSDLPLVAFSVREGGFLCDGCLSKDREAFPLAPVSVRLIQTLRRIPVARLGEVEIKVETRNQIRRVIQSFMDTYLPLSLKSKRVLDQLSKGYTP